MARKSKNLSLDPEAVRRGERYSRLHRTNVSQLVSNFLEKLPIPSDADADALSPAVKRLLGVAEGKGDLGDYHRHLEKKYRR